MWHSKTVWFYLLGMFVWGLYFDLLNFGDYDFISRETDHEHHASAFGIMDVFRITGYLIAPILAGLVISELVDWKAFALALLFLSFSVIMFVVSIILAKRHKAPKEIHHRHKPVDILLELRLWRRIGKQLWPLLLFTIMLNIYDSFFWTVGPLLSEHLKTIHPFGGFLLTIYSLPSLFMGWVVGNVSHHFGKKNTAFVSFIAGSLVLSSMFLLHSPFAILVVVFLASAFSAMAWPSIKGAFADYVSESQPVESEIEGLADFSNNIGFVIGPIIAGFLSDQVGNTGAFALLGLSGVFLVLVIKLVTPKSIRVNPSLTV
jgi:MFS family permease